MDCHGARGGASDTCVVGDLTDDPRWPAFSKLAADSTPVRSVVSGALRQGGPRLALSLYGAAPLTQIQVDQGLLLIEHARALLQLLDSRCKAAGLQDALESNRQIGAAVGIIMGSSKVTLDRAFDMLSTTSQHLNTRLRDLADEVVMTGELPDDLTHTHRDFTVRARGPAAIEEMTRINFPTTQIVSQLDSASRFELTSKWVGGLRMDRFRANITFTTDHGPTGLYSFVDPVRGRNIVTAPHRKVYEPGQVYYGTDPDVSYSNEAYSPHAKKVLWISREAFDEVLGRDPQTDPRVRFTSYDPIPAAQARRFSTTFDYLWDLGQYRPDGDGTSLLPSAATRLMIAAILNWFPNDAQDWISPARDDATLTTLRLASAFIEDNANNDVGLLDIARAAHVTPQSVVLAFRRHLGTTPHEYQSRVRLHAARDELITADPDKTSVRDIALRWGFPDMAKFRGAYLRLFGQTPEMTLRD